MEESIDFSGKIFDIICKLPELYSEFSKKLEDIPFYCSSKVICYRTLTESEKMDSLQRIRIIKDVLEAIVGEKARNYEFCIESGYDDKYEDEFASDIEAGYDSHDSRCVELWIKRIKKSFI